MRIDPEVLAVLAQATVKGKALLLPELDRKLYLKTNTVLSALGGRWDTRTKTHVFDTVDPGDAIVKAIDEGEVQTPQEDGFFATPAELAKRLVLMADIEPEMTVLEPSAGNGALVKAIFTYAFDPYVVAFEIDKDRWAAIAKVAQKNRYEGVLQDFLDAESPYYLANGERLFFDRVVMNPPFARQQDILHVTHALKFLKPGGVLVAVMSAGIMFREDRRAKEFRALVTASGGTIETLPDGSFSASGTDVRTVVVKMRKALGVTGGDTDTVRKITDADSKEPLTVDTGTGNSHLDSGATNDLQERTTMTTEVVSGSKGKVNGHAPEGSNGEAKVVAAPPLPSAFSGKGGTLFKCDENKVKIGDFDKGCKLEDGDPLKNARRSLSADSLEIEGLAASLDETNSDVVTTVVMRGEDPWILKGARRTIATRLVNERRKKDGRPALNYYVIVESGDPQKLAASGFADDFNRFDTPPMVQAREFERVMKAFGWKPSKLAALTGQTAQTIKNVVSLLKLSPDLQKAVEKGELGTTAAYKLATAAPAKQAEAFDILKSSGNGKMRAVDATAAVARAKSTEAKPEAKPNGKAEAKPASKPAQKPTGVAPQNVAPTASQWRKLLAAIQRGEKGAEAEDGVIAPKDPDFVRVRQAIKEDPALFIRVAAGDVSVSKVPGLKKCFAWVGVELA